MRPITLGPLSPKTANTTCFNAQTFNSTGAATAPTTTTTDDGLAHKVTLIAPVQATLAGITFTIIGTDCDGKAQTETGLTGPASGATVTSTKYFKTVTSIQPSATMGALVVSVGTDQVSLSQTIPIDWRSNAQAAMTATISGTINFTVTEVYANVFDVAPSTLTFASISALAAKTGNTSGAATLGATAVRFQTNTVTNGATYTLYVSQPNGYMA